MPELNYSVSQYQATETSGDNFDTGAGTGTGQLTQSLVTLVITPDSGFTVSANDFSIGGAAPTVVVPAGGSNSAIYFYQAFDSNVSLPSEVIQVGFVNSVVGGGVANNVINVNVLFIDDFVMPSNNITINIDIDGEAKPIVEEEEPILGLRHEFILLDRHYLTIGDSINTSKHTTLNAQFDSSTNPYVNFNTTGVGSGYQIESQGSGSQNQTTPGNWIDIGNDGFGFSPNVTSFSWMSSLFWQETKWKVSKIQFEYLTGQVYSADNNNMTTTLVWKIKPEPGFVVAASDFAQMEIRFTPNTLADSTGVGGASDIIPSDGAYLFQTITGSPYNPEYNGVYPPAFSNSSSDLPSPAIYTYNQGGTENSANVAKIHHSSDTTLTQQINNLNGTGNLSPNYNSHALVFSNTTTPYASNNEVRVTYNLPSDFEINTINIDYTFLQTYLMMSGRATPIIQGQGGMPAIDISSYVNIVNPNSNGGTATVTGSTNTGIYGTANTTSVTSVVENGGFTNEATVYSISGTVPESRSTVIATIRIDADTNKYFLNAPSLTRDSVLRANNVNTNDIIKLSINSVERTNNKATAYILDVKYKNNVATTSVDNLKLNLNYKLQTIVTISSLINRIIYGKNSINSIGEYRQIILKGKASTPFVLTLNKALHSEGVIGFESGSEVKGTIIDTNGDSILSSQTATSTLTKTDGSVTKSINSTIGTNGKYSFNQTFPELPIVLETLVNGAITVASKTLVLDTTVGVEAGDQIFFSSMRESSSIKVVSVTNTTTLVLSETITIADNLIVKFKRSTSYHLNITPSTSLASNIPTTTPTYVLNQYVNPIITLRVSTSDITNYKINAQALPGSGRQQYDIIYGGKPNSIQSYDTVFPSTTTKTISYLLDSETSKTFTAARTPFWSNYVAYDGLGTVASNISVGSDWQVDRKVNYNTSDKFSEIEINNIAITATGAETITITFEVIINQFGARDTVYDLDLDKIVTIS